MPASVAGGLIAIRQRRMERGRDIGFEDIVQGDSLDILGPTPACHPDQDFPWGGRSQPRDVHRKPNLDQRLEPFSTVLDSVLGSRGIFADERRRYHRMMSDWRQVVGWKESEVVIRGRQNLVECVYNDNNGELGASCPPRFLLGSNA